MPKLQINLLKFRVSKI